MFFFALNLAAGLFALPFAALAARRGQASPSRRAVWWLGLAWVLAVTAENWILGPWSFAQQEIDQDFGISTLLFDMSREAGQFSHRFAGGQDVAAMSLNLGQYAFVQRWLLEWLPLWMAHGLNMILGTALGVAGTYLAARRMFSVERAPALVLAGLFGFGHMHLATFLWANGFGYSLAPLAVYLVVGRQGRRWYWSGVAALAVVHAISCTPNQSFLGLALAVVLAALIAAPKALPRSLAALAIMVVAVLANWHESLYAKVLLAPFSYRGSGLGTQVTPVLDGIVKAAVFMPVATLLLVLACLALIARRHPQALHALLAGAVALCLGAVLVNIPWAALGMGFLGGVNFRYAADALATVSVLVAAVALGAGKGGRVRHALLVAVTGLAAFQFAWHKAAHLTAWISQGGLTITSGGLEKLQALPPPGGDDARVRSLLLPHRLPLNIVAAAGRDSFDGAFNLYDVQLAQYWQSAVFAPLNARIGRPMDVSSATLNLETPFIDLKCCDSYRLADFVDLDALRIANVGEVVTTVPLTDPALQEVTADPGTLPVRNSQPIVDRLRGYARQIAEPVPVRLYRLTDPLPRAFGASSVSVLPNGAPVEEMVAQILRQAPRRVAVVRAEDWQERDARAAAQVESVRLGCDSITLGLTAGSGGAVVVNMAFNPFWRATADGRPLSIARANMVHMAVSVPPGTRNVEFRYGRPTLRQRLAEAAGLGSMIPDACPTGR